MPPRSEAQESHSYDADREARTNGSGGGHWKTRLAGMLMVFEVKHWFRKQEKKVAKEEKKAKAEYGLSLIHI